MIFNATYSEVRIAGWSNIIMEFEDETLYKNNYNYLYIILIFVAIGIILKNLKKNWYNKIYKIKTLTAKYKK